MADYKRLISYMYQYENGVKKKNVGYARVEARNGQCKITLHMQLLGLLDGIFPTYLIQRQKDDMELVYLGDSVLKNQVMDSKLTTKETNIMNSGLALSDMGGLLLFLNEHVFYATEWDDMPIVHEEVMAALKPKPQEEETKELEKSSKALQPVTNSYDDYDDLAEAMFLKRKKKDPVITTFPEDDEVESSRAAEKKEFESVTKEGDEGGAESENLEYNKDNAVEEIEKVQETDEMEVQEPEGAKDHESTHNSRKIKAPEEIAESNDAEGTQAEEVFSNIDPVEKSVTKKTGTQQAASLTKDNTGQKQKEDEYPDFSGHGSAKEELKTPFYKMPRGWKTVEGVQKPNYSVKPVKVETAKIKENTNSEATEAKPKEKPEMKTNVNPNVKPIARPVIKPVAHGSDRINDLNDRDESNESYTGKEESQENAVATKIFASYPRIYPFEDNEITICVKIEPKDIGFLPAEVWTLSNNSFLLHGYYCYHHLIFAKLNDRYGGRYILGVPGIYHNRERFMARMFGFENFKSIRKRDLRQGDFGYWHLPIPM
ncbi:hypothetical protein I5677_13470 [Mobilitalea sibirica]|uniref:DUF6128 domain-containing protein n=1 Tax=Mobilitalea sibirica TaxID=1462919 RepID=A0A8J7HCB1_9FIRM|nr:DUF6128 domain-containing protein [Mobilitalea sibirica]MBH1941906.1 hypothetical protein [Mobilitalea sibirica]